MPDPVWRAPSSDKRPTYKLGWLKEQIQQGEGYVRNARATQNVDESIDLIAGMDTEKLGPGRSTIQYNRLKREIREIVAVSSTLRPVPAFRSDNPDFTHHVTVLNKCWRAWWGGTFADRAVRKAKQWAAVTGTGYLSPMFTQDFWVAGRGDIQLFDYGVEAVLPVQMGKDGDLQKAYVVIVKSEIPVAMAHAMFPTFQDMIVPDRTKPGWFNRTWKRIKQQYASPALNAAARDKRDDSPFPVCDFYTAYILDLSINESGHDVPMGDPDSTWFYKVPSYGTTQQVGQTVDGRAIEVKVGPEQARLYPLRRMMQSFNNCLVYDGTGKRWDAKVPLVRFTCDDWPWEPFGIPLTKDGAGIQDSIQKLMRNVQDSAEVRLDPPLVYDEGTLAKTLMETLDLRRAGQRIGAPLQMVEKFIQTILPKEHYDVPPWIESWINGLKGDMDYLSALPDMKALAKARQIPSGDSIEKLLELSGPISQDIGRSDERSLCELANMVKCDFFQWYTTRRRMQMLGEDGVTEEDFDFEPGELVPSHMAGEDPLKPSKYDNLKRAQFYQNSFFYQTTPGQIHQTLHASRKLMTIQQKKTGFPIDPWTEAEIFDTPNFGPPPKGADTILERWIAWQFMKAEIAKEVAQLSQPMGGDEAGAHAKELLNDLQTRQPGRPSTDAKPPQIKTKDQGTRSTVVSS